MSKTISISDFIFTFIGYGKYKVTYTSPKTNVYWTTITTDMHLIDATRNAEQPMTKDLNRLKELCKFNAQW